MIQHWLEFRVCEWKHWKCKILYDDLQCALENDNESLCLILKSREIAYPDYSKKK